MAFVLTGKNVYFTILGCPKQTNEPNEVYRKHIQECYEKTMRINKLPANRALIEHVREILMDPVQYKWYLQIHCTNTLYEVLQVQKKDDYKFIKQAYRKLCLILHPDRWGQGSVFVQHQATLNFQRLNEAHQVLHEGRQDYDLHLSYNGREDDDFYEEDGDFEDARWAASGSEAEEEKEKRPSARKRQKARQKTKERKRRSTPRPQSRAKAPPPAAPLEKNIQEIRLLFTLAELYSGKVKRTVQLTCGFRLPCGTWVNQDSAYTLELPKRTAPGCFSMATKRGRYNHVLEECADLHFFADLIPGSDLGFTLAGLNIVVPLTVPLALTMGGGCGTVALTLPDQSHHEVTLPSAVHHGQEIAFPYLMGLQRPFTNVQDSLNSGCIIGRVQVQYPILRPLEQKAFFTFMTALSDPNPLAREGLVDRVFNVHQPDFLF